MTGTKLNVVVIDDDEVILEYIEELLKVSNDFYIVDLLTDGSKIFDVLRNNKVDVVILDIEMPTMNGMEIGEFINDHYPHIKIIFMTGHSKYALEGYKYYPFDFLVKPINPLRLNKTLKKIVSQNVNNDIQNQGIQIGIKVKKGFVLVNIDEISYIEKQGRKVHLYLKGNKSMEISDNLKVLEEKLIHYGFYRPHQSYIIPLNNVRGIVSDEFMNSYNILLKDNDTLIKVSRLKYKELKERLLNYGNVDILE
ncbi:LytR/AlgR family response regulator transcription factor [Bacillus alveayuensis]|uniref:LytR/AlgR family response regulator transcription factor n=1 Tax=Aeribacillus alveayuensis TaxID=279215 RepID=UPI0005D130D0|nr:LytTR family DNA-binding domain-containing protein [Bacillus alveayuensis]